jgi:diguanylate cyclase (GGDEF)-like protein/PAS domain S-box-containing protein
MFSEAPLGIALVDSITGHIYEVNRRFADIAGRTPAEMRTIDWMGITHPDDLQEDLDQMALLNAGEITGFHMNKRYLRPDDSSVWISMTIAPLDEPREPRRRHLCMIEDISDAKQAEQELLERERRLESIIQATRAGTWEWNVQTGEAVFSKEWARIAGYTLDELAPISIKTWEALVHPDDLEQSNELMERHFAGELPFYDFECRMKHKDGRWVWAHDRGRVITHTSDGRPLMMFGTLTDIAERRQAEDALRESEEKYRQLIENSHDIIYTITSDGTLTFVSPSWTTLLGHPAAQVVGHSFRQFVHPDDQERCAAWLKNVIETGQQPEGIEYRVRHMSGSWRWHFSRAVPLSDGAGAIIGYEGIASDITDRKQTEAENQRRTQELAHLNAELLSETAALEAANATITRIAATDDLTGLANRRHFYGSLEKAVSLARRHSSPLALVSFDLDGLKHVNDQQGHRAGDEVLAAFAALLVSLCRAEDLPARLGGDEFSLLMPGIDLAGGRGFAERVLAAARSCAALKQHGVTVSGGAAAWSPDELPDDLLRRADDALYAAKRGGGDSVAGV